MSRNSSISTSSDNSMESTNRLISSLQEQPIKQPASSSNVEPDNVIRVSINKESSQPSLYPLIQEPDNTSSVYSTETIEQISPNPSTRPTQASTTENTTLPSENGDVLLSPQSDSSTSSNPFIKKAPKFTVKRIDSQSKKNTVSLASSMDPSQIKDKDRLLAAQKKHDAYTNRISKIEKEIVFLSNLLPPYNVEIDYATRTKITRAIEKLRMKQDELMRKKYDLGITISRLWRGHDENDLWVKGFSNS
ncbi:hypothetical protein DIRU0_C13080 [Diutina rugosa]